MARNVVLLCLDTVRKDFFDEYATRLRSMADVSYEQCRAASSWSVPSHASMFTGDLPSTHGIHTFERSFEDLERSDTFLADLPNHRAIGTSANVWAGPSFGFDGLFDEFSAVSPDRRFPEGIDVAGFGQEYPDDNLEKYVAFLREAAGHDAPLKSLMNGVLVQFDDWFARAPVPKPLDDGADTIVREATSMVEASAEPFFLFANIMDAHGPLHHVLGYDRSLHEAPLAWTSEDVDWHEAVTDGDDALLERYRGLYAAAIDYLDRIVADFVESLLEETDRETVVVVTSDHGDNLGTAVDAGQWGHVDSSLSEGLLHVPLLVVGHPDAENSAIERYVSHLELGRLLTGLAAGTLPDVTASRIPAERFGFSGQRERLGTRVDESADRSLRCVYDGAYKYQWGTDGSGVAFKLDPGRPCWQEATEAPVDVSSLEAPWFDAPLAVARERAEEVATAIDVDGSTEERLRDLGYL